jgi:aryl-alcohol dehydrogenase-like predicted oxidoreductase
VALLRAVSELGIDHIDTAEFYGNGSVNRAIAAAFPAYADSPLIATKVGAREVDGKLVAKQKPAELREDVVTNLRALGRENVDLVYLRRADIAPGIIATGDQVVPIEDQLAELSALRDEGLIGAIGLSNVTVEQLRVAIPVGIDAVQNFYNLLDRDTEPVLDLARMHGIAWIPYFPLGSGFPGRPRVTDVPSVIETAADLGATPSQVGLAWLLAHYDHTLLIPGSGDLEHIRQNLAAGNLDLLNPDRITT